MIEIIATTVEDALKVEKSGADRIELVSALSEGGLTPSYGMIEEVVNCVSIPVNVMIRPHAKSFYYTRQDIEVMKKDIAMVKKLKANGVVFGTLTNDQKNVDEKILNELLNESTGLEVTFHRAIDEIDPLQALKVLTKYPQITNLLTSGGNRPVEENIDVLNAMIVNRKHINILIGGGLTKENICNIMKAVETSQYHLGTSVRTGKSAFQGINMNQLTEMINIIKINL